MRDLSIEAYKVALEHIRPDVERGDSLQSIQSSMHGNVSNGNWVDIRPGFKINVCEVGCVECDFWFSLRKLFAECQKKQVSLL